MEKLVWHNEERKVNELIPYKGNPRMMTEKQKKDLEKSLKKFNLMSIPVVNIDNIIVSGHQRLKILQLLGKGEEVIDVRVPNRGLTPKELKEANLRENKNLGSWDYDLLANFEKELLVDVGFSDEELDDIFGKNIDEEFDAEKELDKFLESEERRVKDGDLWQLGEHKLIIGDCTNRDNWDRLFGEERFDLLFTDPPYLGVSVFGHKKFSYTVVKEGKELKNHDEWLGIANNFKNVEGSNVLIFEKWKNVVTLWNSIEKYWKIKNMIIWHALKRYSAHINKKAFPNGYDIFLLGDNNNIDLFKEEEIELNNYLKESKSKLLNYYDIMLYGQEKESYWDRRKKTEWVKIGDHISYDIETSKTSTQNVIMGTKPIPILIPYVKILSPRNGIVAEPFSGSGSTIIASEIMKRRCRAMEIEPIYGEVILARWEKLTGKKAVKINGNE